MSYRTFLILLAALFPLLSGTWLHAQETAAPPSTELAESTLKKLRELQEMIAANRSDMRRLSARIEGQEGLLRKVLEQREDRLAIETLEGAVALARLVADEQEAGKDIGAFGQEAIALMEELPGAAIGILDRLWSRAELTDMSASAVEQAESDRLFFEAFDDGYLTFKALIEAMDLGTRFGIDVTAKRKLTLNRLANSTENFSVFLDIASTEARGLRDATAALPGDAELAAQLRVADRRVQNVAKKLEKVVSLLENFDFNTTRYRQQLLTVTGEVTSSGFSAEVILGLIASWWDDGVQYLVDNAGGFLFKVFVFVLILWVFIKLARLVQTAIERALARTGVSLSELAKRMVLSVSRNAVIVIGMLVALSQVGISLGPVLTGLGIAGFIIGFALQDSLSNFASGMLILLYKPFDVGDVIEVAGVSGRVSHMSLVNTTIHTFDNQSLIVPNNKIWQDVITNYTFQQERRVDMEFGITYDEDIDRVEAILREVLSKDDRILTEPEPLIKVGSFGDSSVNILCRPWVKTDDYWEVLWDTNKSVKQAFDREGITIPFPQRDVHLFNDALEQGVKDA